MVRVSPPPDPVTVRVNVPCAPLVEEVEIVIVDVCPGEMEPGLKDAEAPDGKLLALNETALANP